MYRIRRFQKIPVQFGMRSHIFFDFDRTLIDTDALKAEQAHRIAKITQLSVEDIHAGMRQYIDSIQNHLLFSVEGYAQFLSDLYGVSPGDVLKIYLTDCNYIADYVFPEVYEVLQTLSENNVEMGIYSTANPGHQRIKVEHSGVLKYIPWHKVVIAPNKLAPEIVAKVPNKVTLIDDDLEVLTTFQRVRPDVEVLWINRKQSTSSFSGKMIYSLRELLTSESAV